MWHGVTQIIIQALEILENPGKFFEALEIHGNPWKSMKTPGKALEFCY